MFVPVIGAIFAFVLTGGAVQFHIFRLPAHMSVAVAVAIAIAAFVVVRATARLLSTT